MHGVWIWGRSRRGWLALLVSLACVAMLPTGADAAPAPVPCKAIGGGKYDCHFYPAGDGIAAGAPVQSGNGSRVGFLNQGTNWVVCQATGGEMRNGASKNHWFAWTEANDHKWGWVNAVFAKGGANDGRFGGGVPNCGRAHGLPPGTQAGNPTPIPPPVHLVPCSSIGDAKYDCSFYPAGDGITAGAPVQSANGSRVGFLNQGTNWVVCQQTGKELIQGKSFNDWWAWTEANDHEWGWVNAIYAKGGDNDQRFARVPGCAGKHGSPPQAASPAPPPAPPKPAPLTGYVALGDSYSAGEGVTPTDPASGSCDRSRNGYPALLATAMHLNLTSFAACSAAKIPDVERYQLSGLSATTGYVTISIGGNDADFAGVVGRCGAPYLTTACKNIIRKEEGIIRHRIAGGLNTLYSEIRADAPNAKVAVVGYPQLWDASCLHGGNLGRLIPAANLLDDTTMRIAQAHGFRYVDPRPAFRRHSICSTDSYINGLLTHTPRRSFHPNAKGYREYERLVAAALR